MAARVSVLVPTRNEADNVVPLVERLERCLAPDGGEVVFVDDSDDDAAERVRRVAGSTPLSVVLVARARRGNGVRPGAGQPTRSRWQHGAHERRAGRGVA